MSNRSELPGPSGLNTGSVDILSEILNTIQVAGSAGHRALLSAPWGISLPTTESGAPFYVVSEGSMYLRVDDGAGTAEMHRTAGREARLVESGDLVMLPAGGAHTISSEPDTPAESYEAVVRASHLPAMDDGDRRAGIIRFGGGGARSEIYTGVFRFDDDPTATILKSLGSLIHIRGADETSPDFRAYLGLSCHEVKHPTPGSRYVTAELTKLLFIQVIRSAMTSRIRERTTCAAHPFALMFHPHMAPVAEAIHLHPDRDWKVDSLAQLAGMSRTAFSQHFTEITGVAPVAYLTRWRMIKSGQLLRTTNETLAEIASKVGYGSEAAFSIAFKREMGVAPGRYREKSRATVTAA